MKNLFRLLAAAVAGLITLAILPLSGANAETLDPVLAELQTSLDAANTLVVIRTAELADAEADLTEAEGILTAAELARDAAVVAESLAQSAYDIAAAELVTAGEELAAAQGVLEAKEAVLDGAEATLRTATGAYDIQDAVVKAQQAEVDGLEAELLAAQQLVATLEQLKRKDACGTGDGAKVCWDGIKATIESTNDEIVILNANLAAANTTLLEEEAQLNALAVIVGSAQDAVDSAILEVAAAQEIVDGKQEIVEAKTEAANEAASELAAASELVVDMRLAVEAAQDTVNAAALIVGDKQQALDEAVAAQSAAKLAVDTYVPPTVEKAAHPGCKGLAVAAASNAGAKGKGPQVVASVADKLGCNK